MRKLGALRCRYLLLNMHCWPLAHCRGQGPYSSLCPSLLLLPELMLLSLISFWLLDLSSARAVPPRVSSFALRRRLFRRGCFGSRRVRCVSQGCVAIPWRSCVASGRRRPRNTFCCRRRLSGQGLEAPSLISSLALAPLWSFWAARVYSPIRIGSTTVCPQEGVAMSSSVLVAVLD